MLSSCQHSSEPLPITIDAATITLKWDEPSYNAIDIIYPIESYELYYRMRGDLFWFNIGEIPAGNTLEYNLQHKNFGNGMFEFAVRAKNAKGVYSPLHVSTDIETEPSGGWYIIWVVTNQFEGSDK
jgi:hypothetical protein